MAGASAGGGVKFESANCAVRRGIPCSDTPPFLLAVISASHEPTDSNSPPLEGLQAIHKFGGLSGVTRECHVRGSCNSSLRTESARAISARCAFSELGRIQTSRSFVARTRPCAASACAPTTMYSTLCALNSANRSLKSWFISASAVPLQTLPSQLPYCRETLLRSGI